uniref:LEM domain-containing protein n=1 Tax=Anopheles coluzzii TaxID=1518534 RepID=A0A8W7Q1K2_ANOCL
MAKAREMYLALCLLDAIEDANIEALQLVLDRYGASPNTIFPEKGVAPMHLVIGADDETFALRATSLMLQRGGSANLPAAEQMLTPLHVAANLGRVAIVRLLLRAGGNVELLDEEDRTPIQHAIDGDHFEVVQVIQNHVFEQKIDQKRKQLIKQQQQEQQQTVLSPSMRFKKSVAGFLPAVSSTRLHPNSALTALQVLEEHKLTPNKLHYNFDATSPYYVNITHRRKDRFKTLFPTDPANRENTAPTVDDESLGCEPIAARERGGQETALDSTEELGGEEGLVHEVPSRTNLFELTERNLRDFTRDSEPTGRRRSFIECWREKIAELRERTRISRRLDDIDRILNSFSENTVLESFMDEVEETFREERLKTSDETVVSEREECQQQFPELIEQNVPEEIAPTVQPQFMDIVQISEEYIHTDDEAGVVFREKRMITAPSTIPTIQVTSEIAEPVSNDPGKGPPSTARRNPSLTSLSTAVTLPPLDYDTDALRAELTTFGEPPGPITSSTKKLYLRKLVKLRRHPERLENVNGAKANPQPTFSVELGATVRKEDVFEAILDHQSLEDEMASEFQSSSTTKVARNLREGHLKKSFVYLLLDPRVSENLSAQRDHLAAHELWKRFLSAVFYVGKGKSSRPYCHLYDAIKLHHQRESAGCENIRREQTGGAGFTVEAEEIIFQCSEASMAAAVGGNNLRKRGQSGKGSGRKQQAVDSAKLNRIIDIWAAGKGVVCLHVFHNIMPAEAYTREAAIIDAYGVQNLTNLKRGDYYGKCLSWPMKRRKQLGILLLYKALLIHLAEGETQLLPNDLI